MTDETNEKHTSDMNHFAMVKLLAFAKWIDENYEQTWLDDDEKEITTAELAKEWINSAG